MVGGGPGRQESHVRAEMARWDGVAAIGIVVLQNSREAPSSAQGKGRADQSAPAEDDQDLGGEPVRHGLQQPGELGDLGLGGPGVAAETETRSQTSDRLPPRSTATQWIGSLRSERWDRTQAIAAVPGRRSQEETYSDGANGGGGGGGGGGESDRPCGCPR